jgi:hypothetical protein
MIVSVATPEVTTTPSTLEKRRNSDSLLPSQAERLVLRETYGLIG